MSEHYKTGGVLRFRGKSYVLFQRGGKSSSPLSFRIQTQGKRRIVSTGTADLTLAKAVAKTQIAEILDGREIGTRRVAKKAPTIAEVIAEFTSGDRHTKERTAEDYSQCLLRIIEDVKGLTREQAGKQGVEILTENFARAYQAKKQGLTAVDYVTPRKINTSINTTLRQAKAIFSKRAMSAYLRAGFAIPDGLAGFMRVPSLRELSHKYSDNPIPQEQIDKMNEDLPALKEKDARLWAIHLIIRLMGLRASEINRARRHWLVTRGGGTFLVINRREGEDAPKRSDGEVPVPQVLLDYFASHNDDHLIPAKTPTERSNLIYKVHSKWVGERMPGRTKTNHELRKWAGSVVATKTNSWERAAEFLRIDLETAKKHYLSFVTPSEPLSLDDLVG